MNILVTGSTGFLGRHLISRLKENPRNVIHEINSKTCNLIDRNNLLKFTDTKLDRIYHLAAWTKAGDFCLRYPGDQWIHNQYINTNMLWFWKQFQPQALMIAMGTSCSYPDGDSVLEEVNYLTGEPSVDLYTYAMSKRMLLQGLKSLSKQYGMEFKYIIPATIYGTRFDLGDSHFIFDLIKKIHNASQTGVPPVLWGDGNQVRELIYVHDLLYLIQKIVEDPGVKILNVSEGEGQTIRYYAEIICNHLSYPTHNVIYDPNAGHVGVRKRVLSSELRRELIGDCVFKNINEGIGEVIEDYISRNGLDSNIPN